MGKICHLDWLKNDRFVKIMNCNRKGNLGKIIAKRWHPYKPLVIGIE